MKKTLIVLFSLLVALSFSLALAQDQPAAKTKAKEAAANLPRIHGVVQSIDKETSTIQVKERKSGLIRPIIFSEATKVTKRNAPGGSMADIKDGTRIIALGNFDEKKRLVAVRIDIRE